MKGKDVFYGKIEFWNGNSFGLSVLTHPAQRNSAAILPRVLLASNPRTLPNHGGTNNSKFLSGTSKAACSIGTLLRFLCWLNDTSQARRLG